MATRETTATTTTTHDIAATQLGPIPRPFRPSTFYFLRLDLDVLLEVNLVISKKALEVLEIDSTLLEVDTSP